MSKKKKHKKRKIKSQILNTLDKVERKSKDINKKQEKSKVEKVTDNTNNKKEQAISVNKTDMKYFKYDLKKLGVAVGITVFLFGVVILLSYQTNLISNFTDELVQWFHVNNLK